MRLENIPIFFLKRRNTPTLLSQTELLWILIWEIAHISSVSCAAQNSIFVAQAHCPIRYELALQRNKCIPFLQNKSSGSSGLRNKSYFYLFCETSRDPSTTDYMVGTWAKSPTILGLSHFGWMMRTGERLAFTWEVIPTKILYSSKAPWYILLYLAQHTNALRCSNM